MDVCHFFGNKNLKNSAVQYTFKPDEKLLFVQYFRTDVLKQIENALHTIYQQGKRATKELLVPIEYFSEVKRIAL